MRKYASLIFALAFPVGALAQSFTGPATITQPTTANHCLKVGSNGGNTIVDAGANCASGAATPPAGSNTQIQYNNAGAFGGVSGAISNGTTVQFTDGDLLIENAAVTGGAAIHAPTSPSGHTDFTLPAVTSDTLVGIAATQTLTNKTISGYAKSPTTVPTCGAGCASVTGTDGKFVATTGTAQTSVVVNFGANWGFTPVCVVSSNSLAAVVDIAARSATSITFGASVALTGAELYVNCQ